MLHLCPKNSLYFLRIPLIERIGFDTFESHLDRKDEAVLVEMHFVDAHFAVVSVGATQWVTMVDDVPFV